MKNIIDILKGLGIEVPTDKESDLNKEVAENYKTVAEFDKKVSKIEKERDDFKTRAENAETTLKDFEGKDFDTITKDRDAWQNKYEDKIKADEEAKEKAELDEAINTAIESAKGKNAKAIIAQLDMDSIKASKNRDKDIANAIQTLKDAEDTAFLFESDPENNRAHFTDKMNNNGNGKTMTKADIMAVTDRAERRKLIKENMDLFEPTE